MSKKISKDGLPAHVNFLEAERKALAVLDLLLLRGVITVEQRNQHLSDATNAVLKEQYWVRIRAKANAMVSNEKATESAQNNRAMLFEWLTPPLTFGRSRLIFFCRRAQNGFGGLRHVDGSSDSKNRSPSEDPLHLA